ncbi:MAG: patatin-like phospholipase family protein, partial [Rhodospirillales bacterium]|nr:patatin-like phospholipase family protein [Rhodospirillales bacterium]
MLEQERIREFWEVAAKETEAVLDPECNVKMPDCPSEPQLQDLYQALHSIDKALEQNGYQMRAALCLSGGGIRSATFALGIIQALAHHKLLKQFHYLSTVSGGGYTGAWLSAWLAREGENNVLNALERRGEQEAPPIKHLRTYSNYLTPKVGLFSVDLWTVLAIILRNVALNWIVLLPPLLLIILGLQNGPLLMALPGMAGISNAVLLVLAILVAWFSQTTATWALPTDTSSGKLNQPAFLAKVFVPAMVAALLAATAFSLLVKDSPPTQPVTAHTFSGWMLAAAGGVIFTLAGLKWPLSHEDVVRRLLPWLLAGLLFGSQIYLGVVLFFEWIWTELRNDRGIAWLAVPWLLYCRINAETLLVSLQSGSPEPSRDDQREWLARSAGWFGAIAVVWLVVGFLVLYRQSIMQFVNSHSYSWGEEILAAVGGLSGVGA